VVIDAQTAVTGLILAGGRAERMGGSDKGLLPLAGEPLIAHGIRRFRPQVAELLISANRHQDIYRTFGCRVVSALSFTTVLCFIKRLSISTLQTNLIFHGQRP